MCVFLHFIIYMCVFIFTFYNMCVCVCVCGKWVMCSVMSDSVTPWTVAHQAPLSMEFSRQEYQSGCLFLLQGIFLTQGSNPDLLHCRWILYHLSHQEALTNGKDNINISVVKTSSSVSMVKVNQKCSTTKQLKLKEG